MAELWSKEWWAEAIAKLKAEPVRYEPPICGPYHPDTVAWLIANDEKCWYCGTKAREHK